MHVLTSQSHAQGIKGNDQHSAWHRSCFLKIMRIVRSNTLSRSMTPKLCDKLVSWLNHSDCSWDDSGRRLLLPLTQTGRAGCHHCKASRQCKHKHTSRQQGSSSPDSIIMNGRDVCHKHLHTLLRLGLRLVSHEPMLLVTGDDIDHNAIRLTDSSLR